MDSSIHSAAVRSETQFTAGLVLIVDDNADAAKPLQLFLVASGFEVEFARNGTEALVVAKGRVPDVVLLDIGLPGVDGYQVVEQLKDWMPELLVIAVTGRSEPDDIEHSKLAGFDHHLVKPVDVQLVEQLLKDHLRRSDG